MIYDLKQIENFTKVKITGAIHVGAFTGEELWQYRSLGLTDTILFEPQKKLYEIVKQKLLFNEQVFNVALGSRSFRGSLNISDRAGGIEHGAGASSSLLEPHKHLIEHPEVTFGEIETVEVERFDEFVAVENIDIKNHNFLNIDVQGYELEVLKGMTKNLPQIQLIVCEVNRDEMYKGCPMIEDIDNFLSRCHFERVHVHWQSESWGDALYVKN